MKKDYRYALTRPPAATSIPNSVPPSCRRSMRLRAELFRRRREPAAVGLEEKKVGFPGTIHAAGFNGIAAITWAGPRRTVVRQALESDQAERRASAEELRARRSALLRAPAAGAAAPGLRQPENLMATA